MNFLSWLTVLLVLTLCGVTVTCVVLNHLNQLKWMRLFSLKQGITVESMENRPVPKEIVPPKEDTRRKMSIPVPGAQMFRKPQ